nr:type I inositol polyphosphate 5-phosphatase 12-like isoform X2 [Tanacetum cinerariifolium]
MARAILPLYSSARLLSGHQTLYWCNVSVRRVTVNGVGAFAAEYAKKTEALLLAYNGTIWTQCSNTRLLSGHQTLYWCNVSVRRVTVNGVGAFAAEYAKKTEALLLAYNGTIWTQYNTARLKAKMFIIGFKTIKLGKNRKKRFTPIAPPSQPPSSHYSTDHINHHIPTAAIHIQSHHHHHDQLPSSHVYGHPIYTTHHIGVGSSFSSQGMMVVGCGFARGGFLAKSAAKETIGVEWSSNEQWWQDAIGKSMGEGSAFERIGSRQLCGSAHRLSPVQRTGGHK